jgi:hypothetical protein
VGSNPTRGTRRLRQRLMALNVIPDCKAADVYSSEVRRHALFLIEQGCSLRSISISIGVNRSTLRYWREYPDKPERDPGCPRCRRPPELPAPARQYAYVLGLYLGDGCINLAGDARKGVWVLRIMCADAWPGLQQECKGALAALRPSTKVSTLQWQGCTEVLAWWKHWPCVLPQHGPGKKHERKIELTEWQREITGAHPDAFARGLFHSDGCRFVNRVRRALSDGDRWYEYPRYMFTNESADILECAAMRSTFSKWPGAIRGATPYPSRAERRSIGLISS